MRRLYRIEQYKDLISIILAFAGFGISFISAKPDHRYFIAALVSCCVLLMAYMILRFSKLLLYSGLSLLFVSSFAFWLFPLNESEKQALVLEKVTLPPSGGFIRHPYINNVFLQKNRRSGIPLNLRFGLSNNSDTSYYIKSVELFLEAYSPFKKLPVELVSKIIVEFKNIPTKEEIMAFEASYKAVALNTVNNITIFRVPIGTASSIIQQIQEKPYIQSSYLSLSGSGQSAIEFTPANNSSIISPVSKSVIVDIDAKIPQKDIAGIEIQLQFSVPGKYILNPKIRYANEIFKLDSIIVFVSD